MQKDIKLSVVIPCYKFKDYIVESINSVVSQVVDFPMEILVRDDCSGDGTHQMLVAKYESSPLVKILDASKNLGPIGNLIELLSHASGEYVAILDGDDFLIDNGYYKRAVDFLDGNREFSMFTTSYQCLENGRRYPEPAWMHGSKQIVTLEDLLEKNYVSAARVFRKTPVRKEIFDGVPYPDWLFNFEVLKSGKSICEIDRCSFVYRIHSGGMFSGTSQKAKEENTIKTAEIVRKNYDSYLEKNQKNSMKIAQVHPGILPIPPNGWGAVEKIIWEYKCNLEKIGHKCDILYLNDIDPSKYDVVHVHMANLALMLHEKNIPYFFTCHDHHAYIYGKESEIYKQNYLAMKHSVKSFVPAKYLVEYFDLPNVRYLSHGVNTDFFKNRQRMPSEHKILCVANNGIGHNTAHDRKGFGFAIKAAKNLNLPITVAGPDNNRNFFDSFDFEYDKLTIRYNLTEAELLEAYQSHSVFVHASDLEAGHPNLTLLEAMSCGLPVVGALEDNNSLDGMIKVKRDVEEIVQALITIMNDCDNFRERALGTASKKKWANIVKQLAPIYAGESMGDSLIRIYESTSINHINAKKASNRVEIAEDKGCKVEILGPAEESYNVKFMDKKSGRLLNEANITNNMWCSTGLTEGLEWKIIVTENSSGKATEYNSAPKDEVVRIVNESGSLGDAIAWIPVVNEFATRKNKKVSLYTPFKDLFQKEYPLINFHDYSSKPRELTKSDYVLRCSDDFDWKALNLQEIASKILGLPHKEIFPKITLPDEKETRFKKKYVCIATQSTSQCKYWNNEDGWVKIVDYLKSRGYDVVCIDKHYLFGAPGAMNEIPYNCIDDSGEKPLNDRIKTILGCEFFIGLSSGLSWLAWACKKKCIMISGFTDAFHEFQSKYRIINKKVCNSCWHDPSLKFDASNWLWCPRKKNFECSKEISYDMVEEKIDTCIKDLSLES